MRAAGPPPSSIFHGNRVPLKRRTVRLLVIGHVGTESSVELGLTLTFEGDDGGRDESDDDDDDGGGNDGWVSLLVRLRLASL